MDRKQVALEQGTDEWLDWRNSLRTASNAPTVMNANQYQTKRQLYEVMFLGKVVEQNWAMRRGSNLEPIARAEAETLLETKLTPCCYQFGAYGASLDACGEAAGKTVKVEIKCPSSENSQYWSHMQAEVVTVDENSNPMAFWQIVHQQLVCPTERNYLFVYLSPDQFQIAEVFVKPEHIEKLMDAWDDFYENPPLLERTDDEFKAKVLAYGKAKKEADQGKKSLDLASQELKDLCPEDTIGFGAKIVTVDRSGSLDLKLLEKEAPDLFESLEKYRKSATSYKKITMEKKHDK